MRHRKACLRVSICAILVASFSSIPGARTAKAEQLHYLSSWPFVATKAIATDPYSNPPICFEGSGGGIIALDVSSVAKPHPVAPNAYIRTGGFVFDVDFTSSQVFAAAGSAGLVRIDRGTLAVDASLGSIGDARVVAAFRVVDASYVLVGTEFGKLLLVKSSKAGSSIPTPLSIEAETFVPGNVSALAVTQGARVGHTTFLVGTKCGGLLRFDVPDAAFGSRQAVLAHLLQSTANWAPVNPHGNQSFVRAVVIDDDLPSPAVLPRAFVATHSDGVFAIDLGPKGALLPVSSPNWPIHPPGISYAHGLALDEHDDRLAVANGPKFDDEWNWWGDCEFPWPCDGAPSIEPTAPGIRIYEQTSSMQPVEVGFVGVDYLGPPFLNTAPVDIAMRKVGPNELRFDIASEYLGFHVARATRPASQGGVGPWTIGETGGFDADDGIPVGSMYDVLVRPDVAIYTANGPTFAAFKNDASSPLMAPPKVVMPGCISLAFDGGTTPRIFGARKIDGIVFYDVAGANSLAPVYLGLMSTNGKPNSCRVIPGLSGPGHPWLYAPNTFTFGLPQPSPGSLFIFDVAAASPAAAVPVASWIDSTPRTYADVAVAKTAPDRHVAWMCYGPHAYGDPSFGIVTLRAQYVAATGQTSLTPLSILPVASPGSTGNGEPAGRMCYDATTKRLYVAFGCNGVSMFDVSNPESPVLLGSRAIPARTALTVRVAPWDSHRLLVTLIGYGSNAGLGILDCTDSASFLGANSLQILPTRFQCQSIDFPPDSAVKRTLFLADGRGGVHLLEVTP